MIDDKTKKKIETMKKAGDILGKVMSEIVGYVKEGVSELEVDRLAERRILELGGEPGFKRVDGYKYTICTSTNDVVVHGVPKDRKLKNGDVFGFDCGVYLNGFHTDMAETVKIGNLEDKEIDKFLIIGKKAMFRSIKQAKAGNRVGNISKTMQDTIESNKYSVVRSLVGHGVGKKLHEEPEVPGYLDVEIEDTPLLSPGMTLAIEAIYTMGDSNVVFEGSDDWTIVTEDSSLAGLFERTIVISENGPELITKLPNDSLNL